MLLSLHAKKRMSQRRISDEMIDICFNYGKILYRSGVKLYSITKKIVLRYNLPLEFEGVNVMVDKDDTLVITTYKDKTEYHKFKKRSY